jgi:phosphopentomutase
LENLAPDDLLLITADHGNDPTWRGTNHTRERVPVVGPALARSDVLGAINFADVGATIAAHLGLKHHGKGAPAI